MIGSIKLTSKWSATGASLLGFFFTLRPFSSPLTTWQIIVLCLIVVVLVFVAAHDIRDEIKKSAKMYRSTVAINNYMRRMLENSGRCEICSRDASWVKDGKIYALLKSKARKRELTFLVHEKTTEIQALQELGADVIEYGVLGFDPVTRFTIVNAGNSASSYVAIGRKKVNEPHTIEELDASHPTYSIATDLIRSLKIANDKFDKK